MIPMPPGKSPRKWQIEATNAVREAVRAGCWSMVVESATGTGKGSWLAGFAVKCARAGWRVMVRVHRKELVEDLTARIRELYDDVGIVQGPRNQILARVVVASVPSLQSRLDGIPPFDLVITDECHHATAPTYVRTFEAIEAAQRAAGGRRDKVLHIGCTATGFRSDGNGGTVGIGSVFEMLVYSYGICEAIADGVLVPPRAIKIETHLSVADVRVTSGGDYDESELAAAVDTPERNRLIARKYLEHAGDRQALAFAVDVAHAQHLAEAMREEGVDAHAVWGDMPTIERERLIDGFTAGRVQALVSRDLLFEGFNAPRCSVLLRARPTRSMVIAVQMVGRGLRLCPEIGKTDCLVLDFADDGVDLRLDVEADMTDPSGPLASRQQRPFELGDLVQHRVEDLGTGAVVEVEGIRTVVRWPKHGDRTHGRPELRLATEDEAEEVAVDLQVAGVTEYRLELLPGDRADRAVGWYLDGGIWSAEAKTAGDVSLVCIVRQLASGEWSVWGCRLPRRGKPTARRVFASRDLLQARTVGRSWIMREGGRVADWSAPWRSKPASDAQCRLLRSLRVARDLRSMTAGEAGCLISSLRARQAIRAEIRSSRSSRYDPTPSPAMVAGLRAIASGDIAAVRSPTLAGLRRRGLLRGEELTDAGRALI